MAKRSINKKKSTEGFNEVTPESYGLEPVNRKYYPRIEFNLEDIPEAESWKIGETYTINVVAVMKSLSQDEKKTFVSFEIREVDGGEPLKSKKRYIREK